MPLFQVDIFNGACPAGTAKKCFNLYTNEAGQYPTVVNSRSDYVDFTFDRPVFGKNPAIFSIGDGVAFLIASVKYTWTDLILDKAIKETLRLKRAKEVMPVLPGDPITPPPELRLVATITEDGVPVPDLPWSTDTESGVTDPWGNIYVTSLDPVHLVVDGHDVNSIGGDESVTIDVQNPP